MSQPTAPDPTLRENAATIMQAMVMYCDAFRAERDPDAWTMAMDAALALVPVATREPAAERIARAMHDYTERYRGDFRMGWGECSEGYQRRMVENAEGVMREHPWLRSLLAAPSAPETREPERKVGCEGDDGLLRFHLESETCEVCAPLDAGEPERDPLTESLLEWWDAGEPEHIDPTPEERDVATEKLRGIIERGTATASPVESEER